MGPDFHVLKYNGDFDLITRRFPMNPRSREGNTIYYRVPKFLCCGMIKAPPPSPCSMYEYVHCSIHGHYPMELCDGQRAEVCGTSGVGVGIGNVHYAGEMELGSAPAGLKGRWPASRAAL